MNLRKIVALVAIILVYVSLCIAYRSAFLPAMEAQIDGPTPEFARVAKINDAVRRETSALRDVLIRDSIMPLIPQQPGVAAMVPDSTQQSGEYLRRLAQRSTSRDVSIPIIAVPQDYGLHPAMPAPFYTPRFFAGTRDQGSPYCAVVVPYHVMSNAEMRAQFHSKGDVLGPCELWARHGAPGPNVERWMLEGGAKFANQSPVRFADMVDEFATMPRNGFQFWVSSDGRRCQAGDSAACEEAVLRDTTGRASRGVSMSADHYWIPRVSPAESFLLEALEREFGTQRFQRFWKSDQPVPQAFQAAFGVPLGEWVHGWAEARYGRPITIGSRLTLETVLLSFLFIGLFVALATATARGRRI